jgi:hypothetical protein
LTEKQIADRNTELISEVIDWYDSDLPKSEDVSVFFLRLSAKYGIKERNIYQILKDNASAIKSVKDWESVKRTFQLKRLLAGKIESKKDPVEILEQLRKEYEGDKTPEVKVNNFIQVYVPEPYPRERIAQEAMEASSRASN